MLLTLTATGAVAQAALPQDWVHASAHMQKGAPAAALPHLESLVRAYPSEPTYRLELAYALFQLEKDARAEYHFRQALGAGLSPQRQAIVKSFLDKIAARKLLHWRFSIAAVPATNAGKRTSATQITAGGLTFDLGPQDRAQSATGLDISAGITALPHLGQNLRATLSFDTLVRHYKEKRLRELHLNARAGLRYTLAAGTHIEGGALIGRQFRGHDHYADRIGVFAAYLTPLGSRAYGRFGIQHFDEIYPAFPGADGDRTVVEASVNYAVGARTVLRFSGYAMRTDATSALQSGWRHGLSAGTTFAFDGGLVTTADVSFGRDRRDGIGALSGVARSDRSLGINASVYHSNIRFGPFTPVVGIGWERHRSNRRINSFSNTSLSLGLTSVF
ncbi:surface lipoprotein assembly modifier [Sulfitobacter sp. HNIBRBA3233]|uniref:surface lipoprotein assembly modifier n=1 Tax=Sulfitobacter marinivivus TaxID=3158558 RepID=UPI0032DF89C7